MRKYLVLGAAIFLLLSSIALADISRYITVQGRLTDALDDPLSGSYQILFKIYDDPTAGSLEWQDTYTVDVIDGIFNVELGTVNPLNIDFDEGYWLEVVVEGETLTDRIRMTSSGYAFSASRLYTPLDYYVVPEGVSKINELTWIDGSCAAGSAIRAIDTAGGLTCEPVGGGDGISCADCHTLYVNITGDTMTGELTVDLTGESGAAGRDAIEILASADNTWATIKINKDALQIWSTTLGGDADLWTRYTYASRFYDIDNSAYYVDPAGTSVINALTWIDGSCAAGSAIRAIDTAGGLTCEPVGGVDTNAGTICGSNQYLDGDGICRTIPDCDGEAQTLNYDQTTHTWMCLTDDGGAAAADGDWVMDGNRLYNNTATYVGLGTSSIDSRLTIQGFGANSELLSFKDSGGVTEWHVNLMGNGLNIAETGVADGRLYIEEGGQVGIGTTSPSSKLHVSAGTVGDSELILEADTDNNNENDNPFITFKQDGNLVNAFVGMEGNAGTRSIGTLQNAFLIGSEDGDPPLQFITNDNVRMTIETDGDVGIGDTTPSYDLDVSGTIRATTDLRADDDVIFYGELMPDGLTCSNGQILRRAASNNWECTTIPDCDGEAQTLNYDQTTQTWMCLTDDGGAAAADGDWVMDGNKLYNNTASYVGIGTNNPQRLLEIEATDDANIRLQDSSGTANPSAYIEFYNGATRYGWVGLPGAEYLSISTTGSRDIIIYPGGDVGIGDTTPSYDLDVSGTIRATTDLRADDDVIFYGELMPDGLTCSNGQILKKTGADNWDCAADDTGDGGGIGGGGSVNRVAKFTGATTIGDSIIEEVHDAYDRESITVYSDGENQFKTGDSYVFIQPISNDRGKIGFYDTSSGWLDLTLQEGGGNVGIGTASPGAKLDVRGTTLTQGFAGPRTNIQTGPGTGADNQWHQVECPSGYAMMGFSVEITSHWDGGLSAKCANTAGVLNTGDEYWTSGSGSGDNTWHSATCGAGYIATGIRAYASANLDTNLALKCTRVTASSTQLTGAGYTAWPTSNVDSYTHWAFCMPGSFMRYVKAYATSHLDYGGQVECTTIYP